MHFSNIKYEIKWQQISSYRNMHLDKHSLSNYSSFSTQTYHFLTLSSETRRWNAKKKGEKRKTKNSGTLAISLDSLCNSIQFQQSKEICTRRGAGRENDNRIRFVKFSEEYPVGNFVPFVDDDTSGKGVSTPGPTSTCFNGSSSSSKGDLLSLLLIPRFIS